MPNPLPRRSPVKPAVSPPASPLPVFVTERQSDPGMQISVVREQATGATIHSNRWRAFEMWTKNRVYGLDQSMRCVEVLDRRSGRIDEQNKVLGYRLGGGRSREGDDVRYAYPFPLAGMEGMLSRDDRQVFTSRIERFVIRIRDLRARSDVPFSSWEDVQRRGDDA